MTTGQLLTLWTIRLSLACYFSVLAGALLVRDYASWRRLGRTVWSAGCVLFLAHVACAFHFYHDWRHAAAFEDTAQQTKELLGREFGAGIYFSYAFGLLWLVDATWSWANWDAYRRRPRVLTAAIHIYMLFIAFHGTVVFEEGPTRWAGAAACILLALLLAWRVRRDFSPVQRCKGFVP